VSKETIKEKKIRNKNINREQVTRSNYNLLIR